MGSREKFICEHCYRRQITGRLSVCSLCVEDHKRMREVERLVRRASPRTTGLPQEIYLKLWVARCKAKKDVVALARAEALAAAWKERDNHVHDQSPVALAEDRSRRGH